MNKRSLENNIQGLFCICAQPMGDDVTLKSHLSLARHIYKMIPEHSKWNLEVNMSNYVVGTACWWPTPTKCYDIWRHSNGKSCVPCIYKSSTRRVIKCRLIRFYMLNLQSRYHDYDLDRQLQMSPVKCPPYCPCCSVSSHWPLGNVAVTSKV